MSTNSTAKTIPFKQLYIAHESNYRQDSPKVKELAESLKTNGQINPILVTNGGSPDPDKPYTVRGGFRRCAAFIANGWQNRDINVTVREYKAGDNLSPIFDGIIDNKDREEVSPLDTAEAIHNLVHGTYEVDSGEAVPVDKKVVAERLGMQSSTLNNFLRVFDNLDPDVAKKCRKNAVPLRVMVAWAGIVGKGRTEEAKAESVAEQQLEAFEIWLKTKTELEETGRKKKPRKVRSSGDGDGGEGKGGAGDGNGTPSMVNKTKTEYLAVCIEVLKLKLDEAAAADKGAIVGRIEALRFVTGDLKKLPGVTKADIEAVTTPDDAEEVEEIEEEAGEE